MPQSFACLHHHLIFSTRLRAPILDHELLPQLFQYIGGTLRGEGCALIAAGAVADHVQLLASLSREISVAELLRRIKSHSSKWIHEQFPDQHAFAWQEGYGAFSIGKSQVDVTIRYIRNQAEHHRKKTFQEEFLAFLKKHEIDYDPRFVWG